MHLPIAFLACALMLAGCATSETLQYSGAKELRGTGGIFKTVDGIDLYSSSEPNGSYKVVGIFKEDHYKGGALITSALSQSKARRRMIAAAKQAGADAVVTISRNYQYLGSSHSGNASTTFYGNTATSRYGGTSVVHGREGSIVALVKYVEVSK